MRTAEVFRVVVGATGVLIVGAWPPSANAVEFKRYYEGLPDLDTKPPFTGRTGPDALRLHELVNEAKSAGACGTQSIAGASEICVPELRTRLRLVVAAMAPRLAPSSFGKIWTTDLDHDSEPELIVAYNQMIASEPGAPEYRDRYAAFFLFRWKGGTYDVASASWFLDGHLHAVSSLAAGSSESKIIVRVSSCSECEPWIYLVFLDFGGRADGEAIEFSYDPKTPDSWSPDLEYVLPGMGHSIEAKVETRLMDPGSSGPQLIQYFDVANGDDEWWAFTCQRTRCQPKMTKGGLPADLAAIWAKGRRL